MSVEIISTDAVLGAESVALIWRGPLTTRHSARSSAPLTRTPSFSSATSESRPHSRSPSPAALVRSIQCLRRAVERARQPRDCSGF